jgi:CMP-N-acetylneuraminic acid synthetase
MYDDNAQRKIVAFVPIRLNSKRIPGKNFRSLGNKPLMAYILETLLKVSRIDETYVYCSSDEIVPHLPHGVKYLQRSTELDNDETLGEEIYGAFVSEVYADIYILAHTTSPYIKYTTIENALGQVLDSGNDSAFSAEKVQTFVWYNGEPLNYNLKKIPRTQNIQPIFIETSAFYIFKRDVWCKEKQRIGNNPYISVVDKIEGMDIDDPDDFEMAEIIYKKEKDKSSYLGY